MPRSIYTVKGYLPKHKASHREQPLREALRAKAEEWRVQAARHKEHGDCYRKGQGWGLNDCANELDALLASERRGAQQQWQPIETAPKEQAVLVYDAGYVGKGMLTNSKWLDVECGRDDAWFDPPPTHWTPLPVPSFQRNADQHPAQEL